MIFTLSLLFAATVTPCNGDKGTFVPETIFFPDELPIGQKSGFSAYGNFTKLITGGTITAKVWKGFLNVYTEVNNICDKTTCPLVGQMAIASDISIPQTFAATYRLVLDFVDQDKEKIACFQVPLKLVESNLFDLNDLNE